MTDISTRCTQKKRTTELYVIYLVCLVTLQLNPKCMQGHDRQFYKMHKKRTTELYVIYLVCLMTLQLKPKMCAGTWRTQGAHMHACTRAVASQSAYCVIHEHTPLLLLFSRMELSRSVHIHTLLSWLKFMFWFWCMFLCCWFFKFIFIIFIFT